MKNLLFLLALSLLLVACDSKKDTAAPTQQETGKTETDNTKTPAEDKVEETEDPNTTWVTSTKYGVKFRVPNDWKVADAQEALSATSPDDAITIILAGSGSEAVFETAMANISAEVKFSELKTEKSSMAVINGLAGFQGAGTAVMELPEGPLEMQFLGYALRVDAEIAIALMIFAEADMYEARKEELEGIIKTIQKAK